MKIMDSASGRIDWARLAAGLATAVVVLLVTVGVALANEGGHGGGGGLPQLNPDTMPTQLFWLVVSFLTLYFMLFGVALPRVEEVLQARDNRISWDISKADELRNESNAILAATDRLLERTRGQAQEIIARTSGEGQLAAKMLMSRFELELNRRTKEAEGRVLAAKAVALSDLEKTVTDLAADMTARLAGIEIDRSRVAEAVGVALKEQN